jgi:hypothetical protein
MSNVTWTCGGSSGSSTIVYATWPSARTLLGRSLANYRDSDVREAASKGYEKGRSMMKSTEKYVNDLIRMHMRHYNIRG